LSYDFNFIQIYFFYFYPKEGYLIGYYLNQAITGIGLSIKEREKMGCPTKSVDLFMSIFMVWQVQR